MRYLLAFICLAAFALISCDSGSCTTATEKTYTPTASVLLATETPSCPKADDRFDVDTAAIIAKFAGGSATYAPAEGEVAKPDYIPATITVGEYTKCLIHTETVAANTECEGNNYFALYFGVAEEEIETIIYPDFPEDHLLAAAIRVPQTDGTRCKLEVGDDVVDGGACVVDCFIPTNPNNQNNVLYTFVWHAPQ